jgi:hypothetical protein
MISTWLCIVWATVACGLGVWAYRSGHILVGILLLSAGALIFLAVLEAKKLDDIRQQMEDSPYNASNRESYLDKDDKGLW